MRILVTGGTGVIGAGAIPELLKAGHEIRLLSRHADRDAAQFTDGVEPYAADAGDPEQLRDAARDCQCVLHIAGIVAEQPPEATFQRVNVDGTRHLLAAATAAHHPFFVYLSSLGADRGGSEYHRSKREAEALVRAYAGPWLILRPGNVFGPGDESVSLLLKLMRALPAVPVVGAGDQPFQPLWFTDLGRVLARAVGDRRLAGRTLELAGAEVTTTAELLDRLAQITNRNPPRLPVPAWIAQIGTTVLESFNGAGEQILARAGLGAPINSAKLSMLLEGSVIPDPANNALTTEFGVTPTPLDDGLEMIADLLPEQLPGEGVGPIERSEYTAAISGARRDAAGLMDAVCEHLADLMPIEFAAEPEAPREATPGGTMTGTLGPRGNIQVRLVERTRDTATFLTVSGHPLAGILQFATEDSGSEVHFTIRIWSQPANVLDWVAMRTIGGLMQSQNWRSLVRRVVALSGGAAAGVHRRSRRLELGERLAVEQWAQRLTLDHRRQELAQAIGSGSRRP